MEGIWINKYRKHLVKSISGPFLETIIRYMKRQDLMSSEEVNQIQELTAPSDKAKAVIDVLAGKGSAASESLQTFIETTNSQLYLLITVYEPMIQKHIEVLQNKFGSGHEINAVCDKPSLERLTNLLLIDGLTDIQQKEHDVMQTEATRGMKNSSRHTPLDKLFLPLSKVSIPPRISVTVGVAGIGKSTLVKILVYKWLKGELYRDVTFIFPFMFRELNSFERISAEKLVKLTFPHIAETSHILNGSAKVVLVFDGLDEFKYPLEFSNSQICTDPKKDIQIDNLITNIIRGNIFSQATVWITSRPTAASQIPAGLVDRMTELRGFEEVEIKAFLDTLFEERAVATRVFSHIKAHKSLNIMCSVPSFCLMIGLSLAYYLRTSNDGRKAGNFPQTMTEIYTYFFKMILNGDWQEKEQEALKIDQTFSNNKKLIANLSRLAFYGLIKRKFVFYEQDMKAHGIDLSSLQGSLCTKIFAKDESNICTVYYFTHITLQEYLAATYYYTAAKRAIFDLFTESAMSWPKIGFQNHFKNAVSKSLQSEDGHLDVFVRFLSGLLSPEVNRLLQGLLLTKDEHNSYRIPVVHHLQSCLNTDYVISSRTVNLMHCLHELQHTDIAKGVADSLRTGSLAGRLTPINCSALAYLLQVSEECMEETNLSNCLSYNIFKSLLPRLLYCHNLRLENNQFKDNVMDLLGSLLSAKDCQIRKISLAENLISNKGAKAIARSLMVNRTLSALDLRTNSIGPKGAKAFADALKINQGLISLNLQNNFVGEDGAKFTAEALHVNRKLTILNLQKNSINHEGAKRIASSLKHNGSLKELNLSSNCIGDIGASAIAEALKVNRSLSTLNLQSNSISNNGATALTAALKLNEGLIDLNLRENSIGLNGAREIANALRANKVLRSLDLTANLLHDEGTEAIASAVQENQTLTSLHLQWNFISPESAKALARALQSNHSITSLDLQENSIGDEGIIALSAALKCNSVLTSLYLQGTSVGERGAKALADALAVNRSLTTLDLRGNAVGVAGVKAIAAGLKVNNSLQTLNLQENSLGLDGAMCIAIALKYNHSLAHINLQGNKIGESGAKVIAAEIRSKSPHCVVEI
ncbi:NLR family CARD domain-containing protein 3 isoform X1 [Pristis pectinata]|uniref:NLR family CARD domain-containing protein 3 isoform X1 n=2 Tax=Pristis pectinata TaxID=685728 RepID=UPI00223CD867|nr:NLR family CARD domain-containing protein 3 isoform X1 [Pristis pectinata]XP_051877341.1 NLR family CARD domain-containing protein 3 isoform X1 [Pristis pectinata]